MSYKWPGIPNGDYSFDHGRAVWNKIINYLRRLSEKLDADIVDATADRRGMMTAADKDKLDGVEPGAEVNQNAFSSVKVGNSTIEADGKTDMLELVAGTGIELTVDTTNDKVTIGGKEASTTAAGLMSATDKALFDSIPNTYVVKSGVLSLDNMITRTSVSGRTCYALAGTQTGENTEIADFGWDYPNRDGAGIGFRSTAHPTSSGAFLIYARNDENASELIGHPDGRLYWRGNTIPTLADLATTSQAGVMSASDKAKLDGLVAYSGATTTSSGLVTTDNQTWAGSKTIANSSDTGWRITYGSGSSLQTMRFEIGSSHVNRGIWDDRLNKWVLHCDNSKCYVGGCSIEKSVPSNAEFTDTVTTVSTSGSGNAVTAITANNGQLSVTKGASFLPLNGGALTGTDIWRSEGNSRLFLGGGSAWNTGSQVWIYSKEVGSGISLGAMATDGTITSLVLTPKGDLKWGGSKVLTAPTLESGTLTPTSNIGSNYSDVKKYGNIGIFTLSAGTPITFSGWTKYHIYTSSIKPKSYTSGYLHNQNGTQGGAYLEMETDGKIYLHTTGGTMPTDNYWHGSLVFFTD